MTHGQALHALLQKLNLIQIDSERLDIKQEGDDICVKFLGFRNSEVIISISDFWRYPGVACYFVNYHHNDAGDFIANCGTPHVDQAIFDLGVCFHAANAKEL